MYKTIILILTTAIILAACSTPISETVSQSESIETEAIEMPINAAESVETLPQEPVTTDELVAKNSTGDFSFAEMDGLLYMREEEKLARDVYLKMYELWNIPIFLNIADSESAHMEAVLAQLSKLGLDDPAKDKANGEFSNPDLQALYDELIAQGSQSLAEALKVGAAIEEIDILDLEERIDQTSNPDILMAYENLVNGSTNHLRSFVRLLEQRTGEVHNPQYLAQEDYTAIINAEMVRGGNNGNGGGNKGNKGNQVNKNK